MACCTRHLRNWGKSPGNIVSRTADFAQRFARLDEPAARRERLRVLRPRPVPAAALARFLLMTAV